MWREKVKSYNGGSGSGGMFSTPPSVVATRHTKRLVPDSRTTTGEGGEGTQLKSTGEVTFDQARFKDAIFTVSVRGVSESIPRVDPRIFLGAQLMLEANVGTVNTFAEEFCKRVNMCTSEDFVRIDPWVVASAMIMYDGDIKIFYREVMPLSHYLMACVFNFDFGVDARNRYPFSKMVKLEPCRSTDPSVTQRLNLFGFDPKKFVSPEILEQVDALMYAQGPLNTFDVTKSPVSITALLEKIRPVLLEKKVICEFKKQKIAE